MNIPSLIHAQKADNNFDDEILHLKKMDSTGIIPEHPIIFLGSSSVKNWYNFDSAFAGYPVLNRAFGGSTLLDQIHYADDILMNHTPSQIILYCGENDFANENNISTDSVFHRFLTYYSLLRKKFPETAIVYISLKPSPSKMNMMDKIFNYNRMVEKFISEQKNISFLDIYTPMLNPDGEPNRDLFHDDMVHMNEKGYAIWTSALLPLLKK